jgi:transcription antitermination factor NusG
VTERSFVPSSIKPALSNKEQMNTAPYSIRQESIDLNHEQWYALYVRCNQEKNVAHSLSSRGVEHFLPCYKSLRRWKDRRVMLELPLFPGYVLVRLPLLERAKVLLVPNVVSLVGSRGTPTAIAEDEIACVRRGIEHGRLEPHEYLHAGQRVVIVEGSMSGMEGVLVRRQNQTRVVVALDSISRAFAVEVDEGWIKAVPERPARTSPNVLSPREWPKQEAVPGKGIFAPGASFASH